MLAEVNRGRRYRRNWCSTRNKEGKWLEPGRCLKLMMKTIPPCSFLAEKVDDPKVSKWGSWGRGKRLSTGQGPVTPNFLRASPCPICIAPLGSSWGLAFPSSSFMLTCPLSPSWAQMDKTISTQDSKPPGIPRYESVI